MSKIHVVKSEKGKFKVLVNWIQNGVELSSPEIANAHAKKLKEKHYPAATVTLWIDKEEKVEITIDKA